MLVVGALTAASDSPVNVASLQPGRGCEVYFIGFIIVLLPLESVLFEQVAELTCAYMLK